MSIVSTSPIRCAAALAAAALCALPAGAGTLAVSALAASPGGGDSEGLIVNLVENCPFPNDLTVSSPPQIEGTYKACSTLIVEGVEVIGPSLFQADQSVALGGGLAFAGGAPATLALGVPATRFAYLIDQSPAGEVTLGAGWEMNLDLATIGSGDLFSALSGHSADGKTHFEALLRHDLSTNEDRLVLRAREDGGGTQNTLGSELLLPAGWNTIGIRFGAAPGSGFLLASVNGGAYVGLSGLDNDRARIDRVRFGAGSGDAAASSGSLSLDEYTSFR